MASIEKNKEMLSTVVAGRCGLSDFLDGQKNQQLIKDAGGEEEAVKMAMEASNATPDTKKNGKALLDRLKAVYKNKEYLSSRSFDIAGYFLVT